MPNLTGRGGAEVCVVVSRQRQGQVYLCDTTNLGSSAHRRHHISEGCPGKKIGKGIMLMLQQHRTNL